MNKLFIYFAISLLIFCALSGWDRIEIYNKQVITLVGIDEKENNYKLLLEYLLLMQKTHI